jgi:hypothetical protein
MENRSITNDERKENEEAITETRSLFNERFTMGCTLSFEGKEFNYFKCSCQGEPEFENGKDFLKHLKEVHGITKIKATSRMIFHADAEDWFQTNNEIDFGKFKAYQFVRCPRGRESKGYRR